MAKATILLVDNDRDFLLAWTALLQNEGYQVIATRSLQEARQEREKIDLAIIDIRLVDDNDQEDLSGLELARELPVSLPKIVLTNFSYPDALRLALRNRGQKEPIVTEFIAKAEGPSALLATIESALKTALSGDSTTDARRLRRRKRVKGSEFSYPESERHL